VELIVSQVACQKSARIQKDHRESP
jgi:hypothetical protein